jgi:hypothetical protein
VAGRSLGRTVAAKVALDQLTWTVFINCTFFFTTTLLQTGSPALGVAKIRESLWPTLKVNWVVWPVLSAVNFAAVPLQYRILFVNVASLFWSGFLSNMANKGAGEDAGEQQAVVREES